MDSRASLIWALVAFCVGLGAARADVVLVREGCAVGRVVVPDAPAPEEQRAAEEFVRAVGLASGAELPIVPESRAWQPVRRPRRAAPVGVPELHVGPTRASLAAGVATGLDDEDAFRWRTSGPRLFVSGRTPHATEFGVARLLHEHLGARWFWPRPEGEVIPASATICFPELDAVRAPSWPSRNLWGAGDEAWQRRNLLRQRYVHHHALGGFFPQELFDTHPEYFPELEGARRRPTGPQDYVWQPNLALPEVAAHAAHEVVRRTEGVDTPAISLAINDSMRFDQSAATRSLLEPLGWFRGRPDYTPLVFTFMNRVAEQVAAARPGLLLSAYAYYWAEQAPPFTVHPNVLPWLTADRSQYHDAAFRERDLDLIRRWAASGPRVVGIYDYAYGGAFAMPRVYHAALAQSVAGAFASGARAYNAEVSGWMPTDGARPWLLAQLLWDADAEPAALLAAYRAGLYGPAAAAMAEFDRIAEEAWTSQPGPVRWIKWYRDETQPDLFPPGALAGMRSALDDARTAAATPEQGARVDVVTRAFGVGEAFAMLHRARRDAAATDGGDVDAAAQALARLAEATRAFRAAVAAAGDIVPNTFPFVLKSDPAARLAARAQRAGTGRAVAERLERDGYVEAAGVSADRTQPDRTVPRATVLRVLRGRYTLRGELLRNGGFAFSREPTRAELFQRHWFRQDLGVLPEAWTLDNRPAEGFAAGVRAEPDRDVFFVRGADGFSLYQAVRVPRPGVLLLEGECGGTVSPAVEVALGLTFIDAEGREIGAGARDRLHAGVHRRETLAAAAEIPEGAAWVFAYGIVNGQPATEEVWFADVTLRYVE